MSMAPPDLAALAGEIDRIRVEALRLALACEPRLAALALERLRPVADALRAEQAARDSLLLEEWGPDDRVALAEAAFEAARDDVARGRPVVEDLEDLD